MVETQKTSAQFHKGDIYEAAAKFHAELAAGEKEAANAMIQAYGESWLKVQSQLDQLLATMPEGGADATWLFEYGRLASIQEQVEAQLRKFAKFAEANIISQQSLAVQAAENHAAELMIKAFQLQEAPGEIYAILAQVPEAAVEDLVGFLSDGSPLHDLLAELGPDASADVRKALVTGVTTGQGPMEIAQRVRSAFSEGLVRALKISRTEQMRAYREASHRKFENAKDINDGWIWYSALKGNTCAACWAMHGTIHPLDQRLDDHVNGQCTPLPKTKHWKEILGQAGEGIEETTVQVPRGTDLFKKLPKEKQIKILGPAKYHAWKKGEIELEDLVARRHDPKWGTMRYTASLKGALQNASLRKAKVQVTVQTQSQLLGTLKAIQAKKIEEEAAAAAAKIKAEVRAEAKAQAAAEKKSYQKVNSAIQGAKAGLKGKTQDKAAWETYKTKLHVIEQKAIAEGAPAKALALIEKNKAVAEAKLLRFQQKEQAAAQAVAAKKAEQKIYQKVNTKIQAAKGKLKKALAKDDTDVDAVVAYKDKLGQIAQEAAGTKAQALVSKNFTEAVKTYEKVSDAKYAKESYQMHKETIADALSQAKVHGTEHHWGTALSELKMAKSAATSGTNVPRITKMYDKAIKEAEEGLAKAQGLTKPSPAAPKPAPTATKTGGKTYQQYNSAVQGIKASVKKKGKSAQAVHEAQEKLQALHDQALAEGNVMAAKLINKNIVALGGAAPIVTTKTTPIAKTPAPTPPKPSPGPTPKPPPSATGLGDRVFPHDKSKLIYDASESQLGGAHTKKVFRDSKGDLWLYKPQDEFRAELDVATARIQARAGLQAPDTYLYTDENGKVTGSIQKLFGSKATRRPAFGQGGAFDPTKLDAKDTFELQKHAALDWMIGNHDGHKEQFVKVKGGGGQVIGIDKGQAFKFWGKDKLDYTYAPNSNVGVNSVYNELHKAWANGKDLDHFHDLTVPSGGSYKDAIKKMMDIPDDEYREILRPYAEKAAKAGFLAVGSASAKNKPEQFLTEALKRKNGLLADFQAFHDKLAKERTAKLPGAVVAVIPPGLKGMQGAKVFYSNQEGLDWGRKHWGMAAKKLTGQQKEAVRYYTGSGYIELNSGLRGEKAMSYAAKNHLPHLDAAMKIQPIPEDVILWRGVDKNAIDYQYPQAMVGKTLTDAGFLSTSVGTTPGFSGKPIFLRIRAPQGTPAYFAYLNSPYGSEREMLLARGQKLFVHSAKKQGGHWIMEVEVVPPGTATP